MYKKAASNHESPQQMPDLHLQERDQHVSRGSGRSSLPRDQLNDQELYLNIAMNAASQ